MKPIIGARITCKHPVHAYYSDYGPNPEMIFLPGMTAIVHSIAPKVYVVGDGPENDKCTQFVVADYDCPETGKKQRIGLNFCNVVKVKKNAPTDTGRLDNSKGKP